MPVLPITPVEVPIRILWENQIEIGPVSTITPSSEDLTDGPKEYAYKWNLDQRWRTTSGAGIHTYEVIFSSAVVIDSWSVSGHNLGDVGASVECQTWNGSTYVTLGTAQNPGGAEIVGDHAPAVSTTRVRFLVQAASADIEIGHLFAGQAYEPEGGADEGFEDPRMAERAKTEHQESSDHTWLGASVVSRFGQQTLRIKHMPAGNAMANWYPFSYTCQARPFVLFWNLEDYRGGNCFCSQMKIQSQPFPSKGYITTTISFRSEVAP